MTRVVSDVDETIDVDIATTNFGLTSEWRDHLAERLPPRSHLHVFEHTAWLGNGGASLSMFKWLWERIADYDLIHIHALFSVTSSVAAWIAKHRSVPYIVRPLGTLSPYTFANRKRALKRLYFMLVDRPLLNSAAAIHFTAKQEATKAERHKLRTPTAIIPLAFGISPPATLPRDSATILFMSRLHPVKGLDLLLTAFHTVSAQMPSARMVIAGSGDDAYEARVKKRVRELDLSDRVQFVGFVDGEAKRAMLASATVFVLPSHQENFGLAIVEALAMGMPVIISRNVDLWPDVTDQGSGIVVDNSPSELADALVRILRDDSMRMACAANAVSHVQSLYSPRIVGSQLVRLYRGLTHSAKENRHLSKPGSAQLAT